MTDSVAKASSEAKSTRLDPPHDLTLSSSHDDDQATPWMAIAGRDPSLQEDQLDRQTSELLAYVQQQNDEIDLRQSELNAKLAQLDNELRTARLRSSRDAGVDLLPAEDSDKSTDTVSPAPSESKLPISNTKSPSPESAMPPNHPEQSPSPNNPNGNTDFEEIEEIVASFSPDDAKTASTTSVTAKEVSRAEATRHVAKTAVVETPAKEASVNETSLNAASPKTVSPAEPSPKLVEDRLTAEQEKIAKQTRIRKDPAHSFTPKHEPQASSLHDHIEQRNIGRSELELEIEAMASSLDASELESERRLLAERKVELDRRASVLQQMQTNTQRLHREALEMRLVTEQACLELSNKAPAEHVQELLANLRARLNEQLTDQEEALQSQASELVSLKESIQGKQLELQQQSAQLQQWVEARHDELKAYASEVDTRALLLDRREQRMREEFSKWEASRTAYQEQLQGMLSKLTK